MAQINQLAAATWDGIEFDLAPELAVLEHIGALAPSELEAMDQALLAASRPRFMKVAFVVAAALCEMAEQPREHNY